MGKIGILGGTFNPIHIGHIKLAEAAYEAVKLDKILIMPTGISYLKATKDVLPKEVRAEIVKLSIDKYPFLEFSDIEIKRDGNTYTFETLLELKQNNPDDELYFIVGADTLFSIENWKSPDIIFANCSIVAMARDEFSYDDMIKKINDLEKKYNANIILTNVPKYDISSSKIRDCIAKGNAELIKEYMVDKAFRYIEQLDLYKYDIED